jgi:hypothetical protein
MLNEFEMAPVGDEIRSHYSFDAQGDNEEPSEVI